MAQPTSLDLMNAGRYSSGIRDLHYIFKWRKKFPHIFTDYTIRYATPADYYVPPALLYKSAIVVDVKFSKEGCDAMSCFPYTETGVIDFLTTPIGGYTQTSETAIQYNQPACFNLDPALAARNQQTQSIELLYRNNKCIMGDSFTKMYFNSPYLRTDEHIVRGVDDVPAFNAYNEEDPVFPERVKGRFNQAYCRRFGREEENNSCRQQWWEILVGFVLGDMIYTTFKIMGNRVLADLRNYDYRAPSALLPPRKPPDGDALLAFWLSRRDKAIDGELEDGFLNCDFKITPQQEISYVAEKGYTVQMARTKFEEAADVLNTMLEERYKVLHGFVNAKSKPLGAPRQFVLERDPETREIRTNDSLEHIITDFLDDHNFIISILAELGFSILEDLLTDMLVSLNKVLIPALRDYLINASARFTANLLGNTYKAMVLESLNRALISAVSAVAKALVRGISAALSVINIILIFITIVDLVLMFWDPYGYSMMFPRGYLDDLSNAFLGAYYESLETGSRELIEFRPIHFFHLVEEESNTNFMGEEGLAIGDYLFNLEVNSNGQMINWDTGGTITDFDEADLVGAALATNDTFKYFKWYCSRHNKLVEPNQLLEASTMMGCFGLVLAGGLLLYTMADYKNLTQKQSASLLMVFLIVLIVCICFIVLPSIHYYTTLALHDAPRFD
ncbi:ORF56 [Agrotis segetum granulovirus]|uniref:ORF56 n=1 Tax=Agrotis segetum granulosis virus TaxID=10464 RepID=Q6QXJ9_GVAS|nr:pif-0 [Agrotis segetum granulovirus]AAS82682.1 ORF56 [Agrotis segetum granulovirus]AHN92107.1 p74 [Agrotis segetum granulovirus]AKN63342.1 pif-0 [Agrotis segetum granulovirus]